MTTKEDEFNALVELGYDGEFYWIDDGNQEIVFNSKINNLPSTKQIESKAIEIKEKRESLDSIKQQKVDEVYDIAKEILDIATKKYSNAEMVLWDTLETQARKFIDTGETGTLLEGYADISEYANRVIVKADSFRELRKVSLETRDTKKREINSLTDPKVIKKYNTKSGWFGY